VTVDDAFEDVSRRARRSAHALARTGSGRGELTRPLREPPVHEVQAAHRELLGQAWPQEDRALLHRARGVAFPSVYGQSKSRAYHIAWRESRYNWRVTNRSSGAAGLYQFMSRTWLTTPYRKHSRYHPRWAALAAMWMWAHGGYHHWQ
jgi:hypothetical protein